MNKRLLLPLFLFAATVAVHAQNANTLIIRFTGAPSGPCSPFMLGINNATGAMYDCLSGAWSLVGGGGGGSGTVTSVSFTGGLISVANPTTTPALTVAGTSGGIPFFDSATTWNTSAALASGGVVLGGGAGTTPATNTRLTFATGTLTVGLAGTTGGVLNLAGSTSGGATLTAPAIAGTSTNPIAVSNNLSGPDGALASGLTYGFTGAVQSGMYRVTGNGDVRIARNGADIFAASSTGAQINGGIPLQICASGFSPCDVGLSRGAVGLLDVGNGTALDSTALVLSGNKALLTSDFTDSNSAGLQVITGMAFTMPNVAKNWSFHCAWAYSEATPIASDQFGVASLTTAATNLKAQAHVITTEGAAAAQTTGNSGNITSTTPTSIVTFTPVGTGEKPVEIDGSIEVAGTGASTLQFYVTNGTAADVIVIKRGSYCEIR